MVRCTDRPAMTLAVDLRHKAKKQTKTHTHLFSLLNEVLILTEVDVCVYVSVFVVDRGS